MHSITGDSAAISRQWVGELPSFGPSGKGEHRRHIVTTGQNLSVATSTFSLHLQLDVQHKVTVHLIVKTPVQLCHTVAHSEWIGPPGNEYAFRIHMDREMREQ